MITTMNQATQQAVQRSQNERQVPHPKVDGLVAMWAPPMIEDISGYGNHGTLVGVGNVMSWHKSDQDPKHPIDRMQAENAKVRALDSN